MKDFAVGETTCDAKKKAWDLVGFKVMEVPQRKGGTDADLWRKEVEVFREMVEELSGTTITREKLANSISRVNLKRTLLRRINETRKIDDPPISGLDALLVSQCAMGMEVDEFNSAAAALADELDHRAEKGVSAYSKPGRRIMMAGTPAPMGYAKLHFVAENSGMRVVVDESCTGMRYWRDCVDETPDTREGLVKAVADRYFKIDCACFSPNEERITHALSAAGDYRIEGALQGILQFCHGFNVEAKAVEMALLQKAGIPSMKLVTDYSEEDMGQLRTRVEAFAELMENRPASCDPTAGKASEKG